MKVKKKKKFEPLIRETMANYVEQEGRFVAGRSLNKDNG